jgi:hypothetical protein
LSGYQNTAEEEVGIAMAGKFLEQAARGTALQNHNANRYRPFRFEQVVIRSAEWQVPPTGGRTPCGRKRSPCSPVPTSNVVEFVVHGEEEEETLGERWPAGTRAGRRRKRAVAKESRDKRQARRKVPWWRAERRPGE